ncbi:MAG: D-alanyl-D-alanine carboxypeptidase/D-alanyl-D-alanine-endopeptidase [Candidatus Eremiobacteraeota bacterium]|nr:D-alanyl-D-alanine carboxypeptidase/D-alanyl-D-alanine-endopeptidase [Candidatus Eremiobacteraeota bacterium]MBV8583095.1 D-alanyl-D-alanine carboxypeptidase/D-alanyl-D-alanine-endopeptidase [Candidatus Eremiobacteraeota bacterium]MBV8655315.1 D-alanyl-D-alanine carboxypeptidase/D-alanyl-D-alanine-endopeptidase [Candidatus Eremiobacteraeota bacterium]
MIVAAALATAIQSAFATPRLRHSIVAAEVYDLDAHRVLYARNERTLMVAASTTKLLTEGTSLALLGPQFRWTTPVYRTGPVDEAGVLHGDLVLVASGDPNVSQRIRPDGTLSFENEDHAYDGSAGTKAVPGDPLAVLRELATQVAKAGIKSIEGRVVVDASLFPDQGAEGGTGVIVSPIVVNDNVVDVTVTPGKKAGDPVAIAVSPQTAYVTFVNKAMTADRKADATIDLSADVAGANGRHTVTITGVQPIGPSILYAYRVPEPKRFAQDAFAQALQDAGVSIAPESASTAAASASPLPYGPQTLVAKHVSLPLAEDVRITLKVSDNLHAALMPYMWAVYLAHAKSDYLRAGFARERGLFRAAGLNLDGAAQQDGLGSSAFFTTDFMVHYLQWARAQAWYSWLFRGLPVMGVDGTLSSIQKSSPARGKVFAKTGTDGSTDYLNDGGVIEKGLAGYITTRGGRHVAFAFYVSAMLGPHDENTGEVAGQILGAMATATYESL